jgi:hypothetical protein
MTSVCSVEVSSGPPQERGNVIRNAPVPRSNSTTSAGSCRARSISSDRSRSWGATALARARISAAVRGGGVPSGSVRPAAACTVVT